MHIAIDYQDMAPLLRQRFASQNMCLFAVQRRTHAHVSAQIRLSPCFQLPLHRVAGADILCLNTLNSPAFTCTQARTSQSGQSCALAVKPPALYLDPRIKQTKPLIPQRGHSLTHPHHARSYGAIGWLTWHYTLTVLLGAQQ